MQSLIAVTLDNAALKASRTGSLGRLNSDGTRSGAAEEACVKKAARDAGGGLLNGDLSVKMLNYATATAAGTDTNRTSGTAGAGVGGRTVVYELTYNQPYIFVPMHVGKKRTHTAITTIQNEPFANANQAATAAAC